MSTEIVQESTQEGSQAPLVLTISGVLALLAEGKNRKEIAALYGRTQTEMNKLVWSHPKLKGRKTKKQHTGIVLEDDTEEVAAAVVTEVADSAEVVEPAIVEEPAITADTPYTSAAESSDWN